MKMTYFSSISLSAWLLCMPSLAQDAPLKIHDLIQIMDQNQVPRLDAEMPWRGIGKTSILIRAGTTVVNHGPKTIITPLGVNREQFFNKIKAGDDFLKEGGLRAGNAGSSYQMRNGERIVFVGDVVMDIEAFKGGLVVLVAEKGGRPIVSLCSSDLAR